MSLYRAFLAVVGVVWETIEGSRQKNMPGKVTCAVFKLNLFLVLNPFSDQKSLFVIIN